MTEADHPRLGLARRAWLAWNADDEHVEAGVQRVARRLRMKTRSSASRRALTLVPVAIGLFAAMAYAQTGGFEHPPAFAARWFGGLETSHRLYEGVYPSELAQTVSRLDQAALGLAPVPVPPGTKPLDPSELPTAAPELEASPAPRAKLGSTERSRRAARARATGSGEPKAGSAWRQIDEALAANDEATARRLLQGLAGGSEDATTQAKARLGLAQLALSRGDCQRATKIAERVARSAGIEEKLVRRAHDIVLRCQEQSGS
jgi:hypothetical protein